MLTGRLEWLFGCCRREVPEGASLGVQVLSNESALPVCQLHESARSGEALGTKSAASSVGVLGVGLGGKPCTPRQRDLRDGLELPKLHHYPTPPGVGQEDTEEARHEKLLEMYQEFVLELFTGMFLTQLTSNRDYSDIHCQLMEDLTTLKLDQSNGRIIEFPLTGVSKVYRIVKSEDKWYSPASAQGVPMAVVEHIVVVEFMRRKLAFVFGELTASQRFLTCMELLIRRAQQKDMGRTLRSLYPAIPPGGDGLARRYGTPKQVWDSGSPCV